MIYQPTAKNLNKWSGPQYRLDASKRKPVPTIPIIYPEERHQDPFHVSFRPPNNLEGAIKEFSSFEATL